MFVPEDDSLAGLLARCTLRQALPAAPLPHDWLQEPLPNAVLRALDMLHEATGEPR